ncbi:uncharacterized protein LOC119373581 [Rhipicephalus sanguineus]|uniref:uncharacterized protein LOC119373581 n=1 Tax=Rhipicephalus sanguineus TaxID=34632 RepID=UPI00189608C3|nr:uncharacterized protein LOC119373581 [Rhipicephalus sanguineus]
MRSTSCSPRSSLASSDLTDYPGAPRPALIVKMNACTLLRQRELARRRENERREQHERAWAERRRQLDRARLSDRLELVQRRTPEPGPSAKERLRALRRSTLEREAEYKREIQSMQARVRAMPLLLERQAVAAARRRLEQQYERKLKELGLSYEWIQEKAQQESHDRQREQRSSSAMQASSAMTSRSRFQSATVHRCPAIRSPPPESTTAVVVKQRSRSASSSLRSALSRTESASDLSGTLHDSDGPEGGLVAFTRTHNTSDEETCDATREMRVALMDT